MRTYVINLERSKERRKHITAEVERLGLDYSIVTAVDGNEFTDEYLAKIADMDVIEANKEWFTKNMVAAALSHRKVYETMVRESQDIALVLEDDVELDDSIRKILDLIGPYIGSGEVALLHYQSFSPLMLSERVTDQLTAEHKLYFPISLKGLFSAAAYVIRRPLADHLNKSILPIRIAPDGWSEFYEAGLIESIRVVSPAPVRVIGAKSNIMIGSRNRITGWLSSRADDYNIPFFSALIRKRRLRDVERRLEVTFTDAKSPLAPTGAD